MASSTSGIPFDFRRMSIKDCIHRPHEVFTNDLIFFLCRYTEIHYMPVLDNISKHSPVTRDVRFVVHIFFKRHRGAYKKCFKHFEEINIASETIYEGFCSSIDTVLSRLIYSDFAQYEVLPLLTKVILMSIDYYECGCQDAVQCAASFISAALKECNERHDFKFFDKIAKAAERYKY